MKYQLTMLLGLLALSSCGQGGGGESIFMYFINGYNGADNVTVIGPTGPVIQGAKFGDRIGVDSTGSSTACKPGARCIPLEFDRTLGGDFQAIVSGSPQVFDFKYPVFALYPQETATMIFAGRNNSGSTIETHLLRHTQSISSGCVLTFVNALSLDNALTGKSTTRFSMVPEFKFAPTTKKNVESIAGFVDERANPFPTVCGDLPAGDPKHTLLTRNIYKDIKANPWFFYTDCDGLGANSICPSWSKPGPDGRAILQLGNEIAAEKNSLEYYKCVQSAVTFGDDTSMGGGGSECPANPTWADAKIDPLQVADCQQPQTKTVDGVPPNGEEYSIINSVYSSDSCNPSFRIRTTSLDVIFGPKEGSKKPGSHQKGGLVEISPKIDPGNEYFFVLIGRPVNPIVWHWQSGTSIANLNDFPYGNGQTARFGDY